MEYVVAAAVVAVLIVAAFVVGFLVGKRHGAEAFAAANKALAETHAGAQQLYAQGAATVKSLGETAQALGAKIADTITPPKQ